MRRWMAVLANEKWQITFDDPTSEWEIVNAWFVKQKNFITRFRLRELVTPEKTE